jgi:hypothetical protein
MFYELDKNSHIIGICLFSYILPSQRRLYIWNILYILNELVSFFIYLYLFLYYFFITFIYAKIKK